MFEYRVTLYEMFVLSSMTLPVIPYAPITKNPPLPTITTSTLNLHKSSYQYAKILSQPPTTTLASSKLSDHPVTFTRNPTAPSVIPSAPTTKNLSPTPYATTLSDSDHIKLFFERFPSVVEYQNLKKTFFKFGQVTKLFLSKRKTALRRRFGFVDILSPLFVSDLCDQTSNLWFDTYKLRVNLVKHHSLKPSLPASKPLSKPAPPHKPKLMFRDNRFFTEVLTSTKPQMAMKERRMVHYGSTDEDKEWLYRSLMGNILPNIDVATLEATVFKSIDKAVSFRFLGVSQVIITFMNELVSTKENKNEGSILYSLLSNL